MAATRAGRTVLLSSNVPAEYGFCDAQLVVTNFQLKRKAQYKISAQSRFAVNAISARRVSSRPHQSSLFIHLTHSPAPAMKDIDDLDDDLLDDEDLDSFASKGGATALGSSEERLAAKYADYLMWTDTGSSHDEALDLANMTEEEFVDAERADNADRSDSMSLDDGDDFADEDDEDDGYSSRGSGRSGRGDYDDDF